MNRAPAGLYRVRVLEPGLERSSEYDFESLERAKAFANDAASETEFGPVFSSIYNDQGEEIYRGRHYGMEES